MSNELQTITGLFQNRLFRIPDYQRGYAWQEPQLVDFWEDLINLQPGKKHYTGLLSLKCIDNSSNLGDDVWIMGKGYNVYHVVDGQQRLTTIVILLNEIVCYVRDLDVNRDKTDDDIYIENESLKDIIQKYLFQKKPPLKQIITYIFDYESDNPSAEYLRYRIFGELYPGTVNETYYTKNLKFAKDFFRKNIDELYKTEGTDGIADIYQKLTKHLMFNIHEIENNYDVFVAFETMNNRGKTLSNLELLKNRLIYLTTLFPDKEFTEDEQNHLRKQINDAWKEIYFQLGGNDNTSLSDDDFLRDHWIIYYTYSRKKGDDYIRFLFNKFSPKNIFEKETILISEPPEDEDERADSDEDDFDDENNNYSTNSVERKDNTEEKLSPEEIADYVGSLKDMAKYWCYTFFPEKSELSEEEKLWINKLNRIGMGYFRPLVAVVISRYEEFEEDCIELFKAIERCIFICFRIGNFNSSFASSDYYRDAHRLYRKDIDLDYLINDINETATLNIEFAAKNFTTKIQKLFRDGDGYYGWKPLRYFLYEYETYLASENNIDRIESYEKMFTKKAKDKVSVEHIFPQTPSNYYWQNQFRQFDDDEKRKLANALGNLLLLSQSINSKLQNDSFNDKKKSQPGRRGYENGCHSEIEVSKNRNWTAKQIYKRSQKLLEFMKERWGISFSDEQFEKLTYVNFAVDGREVPPKLPLFEDDTE